VILMWAQPVREFLVWVAVISKRFLLFIYKQFLNTCNGSVHRAVIKETGFGTRSLADEVGQ